MIEHAFEIDGVTLVPQPTGYEWEAGGELLLGYDGDGAPIKRKYGSCRLTVSGVAILLSNVKWFDFDDGSSHTATLIQPGTNVVWGDYTTVYCVVTQGESEGRNGAVSSLTMDITKVDLS